MPDGITPPLPDIEALSRNAGQFVEALGRTRASFVCGKHLQQILCGPDTTDPFLGEHAAILAALASGDGEGAAAALAAHLAASREKGCDRLATHRRNARPPALAYVVD